MRAAAVNADRLGDPALARTRWRAARDAYRLLDSLFRERGLADNPGVAEAEARLAQFDR